MLMVYQKYNINPMSGCLFSMLQLPLFIAFFEAVQRTPAIFEGEFLGLHLGTTPWIALKNGEWWYLVIVVILALVTHFSLQLNKGAGAPGSDTEKQMSMMNKFMLVFIVRKYETICIGSRCLSKHYRANFRHSRPKFSAT